MCVCMFVCLCLPVRMQTDDCARVHVCLYVCAFSCGYFVADWEHANVNKVAFMCTKQASVCVHCGGEERIKATADFCHINVSLVALDIYMFKHFLYSF